MSFVHEPLEVQEHIIKLNERILRANEEAKRVIDEVAARPEGQRFFAGEDKEKLARIDADIDAANAERDVYAQRERRTREAEALRSETLSTFGEKRVERAERTESDLIRSFLLADYSHPMIGRGEAPNSHAIEFPVNRAIHEREYLRLGMDISEARALAWDTGNVASTVPVTTARTIYQVLEAQIAALRMPTFRLTTDSGEQMKLPKITTHSLATQVSGQGTTLAGTDSAFSSTTLDAFKYAELCKVANEVLSDSGVNIGQIVTGEIGRAVGRKIDADIVAGGGSGAPQGMMTGITGAATIATGGSLIDPTYEKMVDLVYSVNDAYRNNGQAAFLMRDSTAGTLRKLRDGSGGTVGAVLWRPSLTEGIQGGQPGLFLDYPVYTDPNVASLGSNNVIIAYGDWNCYVFRTVGNLMLESDASRYFDTDEVGFRGKWRADGDYQDTTGVNVIKRSV